MQFTRSITFYLIALNFLIFLIQIFIPIDSIHILGLVPKNAIYNGMIWQFATFMFVHGGFTHIFFNMFALFIFGLLIEKEFGRKKFLTYYLICGIGSALLHILISLYFPIFTNPDNPAIAMSTPLIGASGAVFGILTAYAVKYPTRIIFINFIPMPAIGFIFIYGAIEFLTGISGVETGVAHFGHLGGMLTGIILLFLFKFKDHKRMEFVWESI